MSDPLADLLGEAMDRHLSLDGSADLAAMADHLRDAGVRVTGDASLRQTPLVTGDADGTRTRAVYVAPSDDAALLDPDTLFFDLPIGNSVGYSRGYSAAIAACKDALRAALEAGR